MMSQAALTRRTATRLVLGILVSVGAVTAALASGDPPAPLVPVAPPQGAPADLQSPPPGQPATAAAVAPKVDAPSPAAATADHATDTARNTATAANAADPDSELGRLEKRMHTRGYTTHMQNGEKMFCRREEVLGTRLGGSLHCMTANEARVNDERMQREQEDLMHRLGQQSCLFNGMVNGRPTVNCGN